MFNSYNIQNKIANRKSEMNLTFHCCDCGKEVNIQLGEILFYDDKSLIVPKRCEECKNAKNKRIEMERNSKEDNNVEQKKFGNT